MRMWVYDPHTGGKSIPPGVRLSTERRIVEYAAEHHAGKFIRIEVRFHGALCYIDAYTKADAARDRRLGRPKSVPTHLCRIRYFGDDNRWSFAWYNYSNNKYEPGSFDNGDHSTPEEAFECAAHVL